MANPDTERRPTLQPVAWVKDMDRSGQLDLDPPYQRRSVWNRQYQQFFIDTILKNYPVPPIFVNIEVQSDGTTIYHVIDGKQRLLAILEFLKDLFPISKADYSPPELAGKYFSELEREKRQRIFSYFLPFEFFSDISQEKVTEIFDRFNRNVQRLNAQELRHARYSGAFITLMEQLADEPIWSKLRMFGKADVRRMRDVEYTSTIFSLTMHGLEDGDQLDEHYARYDDEIPNVGDHIDRYHSIAAIVGKFSELIQATRLSNRADFYSLWSALLEYADNPDKINYAASSDKLGEFATKVSEVPKLADPNEAGEDATTYSQVVRAGTTKLPNREKRKELLLKYIVDE